MKIIYMASYLQSENISKSYGPKVLFEKIGFNINEGDKIALIAPNGTGKTSLMRILAGKDKSDSGGKIMFLKDIKIAFLEQEYDFDPEKTIFDQIMSSSQEFTKGLDQEHLWEYERRVIKFLTNFNLTDPEQLMKELSGGEVKRVAITQMLATEAEFFIMDEPTNHLDIDAIEFLEGYLSRSRCTLLMVTHDRYFLDRVCNIVMEMDHGTIYTYKGNYQNYLEKREERIANYNAETDKVLCELKRLSSLLKSAGLYAKTVMDFSIVNDMSYYNGITFQGFINGISQSVLSGGEYGKLLEKFSSKLDAVGFAVYIDALERLTAKKSFDADVFVLYSDSSDAEKLYACIDRLIASGVSVRSGRTLPGRVRCKRIMKFDGEVLTDE